MVDVLKFFKSILYMKIVAVMWGIAAILSVIALENSVYANNLPLTLMCGFLMVTCAIMLIGSKIVIEIKKGNEGIK